MIPHPPVLVPLQLKQLIELIGSHLVNEGPFLFYYLRYTIVDASHVRFPQETFPDQVD